MRIVFNDYFECCTSSPIDAMKAQDREPARFSRVSTAELVVSFVLCGCRKAGDPHFEGIPPSTVAGENDVDGVEPRDKARKGESSGARDDPERPLPHLLQQPPSPQPIERPTPRRNLLHRRPTASRCLTTRPSPRVISPGSDCTERRDHFCHGTVAWLRLGVEKVVHHRDDDGHALHQCHVGGVGQDGQSRCGARLHVAVDLATL